MEASATPRALSIVGGGAIRPSLGVVGPARAGGPSRPPPARPSGRAILGWRVGPSARAVVLARAHRLVTGQYRAQRVDRDLAELLGDREQVVHARRLTSLAPL